MNKNEAILKIKESLKQLMKFESGEEKKEVVETLSEVTTKDGIKLSFDGEEITVDTEIFKLDENGNRVPCEDGEYSLNEGKTIVVTSGKVTEIKDEMPEGVVEETPVEDATINMEVEEVVEVKEEEKDSELKDKVAYLEEKINTIMNILAELTGVSEEMSSKFEEFSKQPGGEPAATIVKNTKVTLTAEEARVERFKQLKDSLKK